MVPAVVDLTTAGATGTVNGAIFDQTGTQPTGSGVIHSFVRLNPGGNVAVEQGYNTDARPLQFDENNSPVFTRALPLAEVPLVPINGTYYREFLLDVNQKSSSPQVSLDQLRLYVGNAPDLYGYDSTSDQLAGLNPVYDLNAGVGGNSVLLNARLSHGSGSGDMFLYVPDSVLTQGDGSYVYLYSKFGATVSANGGYEEWAVRSATELSSVSGFVTDVTNPNSPAPVADVLVTLSGTTNTGLAVNVCAWTNSSGFYIFTGLTAGTYNITETVPPNYAAVGASVGSLGDTSNTDTEFCGIFVLSDVVGLNYDFQLGQQIITSG